MRSYLKPCKNAVPPARNYASAFSCTQRLHKLTGAKVLPVVRATSPFLTRSNLRCYLKELFWPQCRCCVPGSPEGGQACLRQAGSCGGSLRNMGLTKLVVRGARQHNLKNISVEIPRNTL